MCISQDGSPALSPEEIRPPDEWGWVSEWKIDGSGERDTEGWEYTKQMEKFDPSRGEFLGLPMPICASSSA